MSRNNGPRPPTNRQLAVGELIRGALARILVQSPPNDTHFQGKLITITQVSPSPDLRSAKVFIVAQGHEEDHAFIKSLNHAASYFRREMAGMVDLKFLPSLRFYPDLSFANGDKIGKILLNIKQQEIL